MEDGRFLSSYYRSRWMDQHIKKTNNLRNGNDFKEFLQVNGSLLISNEFIKLLNDNNCKEK